MKNNVIKPGLALCGACALLANLCGAAFAQPMTHPHPSRVVHHPRRHIMRLKAAYVRDVAKGHYMAAERAHLRARAIRHAVRARHATP